MPGVKNKAPIKFETSSGQNIAADVNCWFHRLCSQPQNALAITCDPMCPPIDLINTLCERHKKMLKHGITPYHVFDGTRHPMKLSTGKDMLKKCDDAQRSLSIFINVVKAQPWNLKMKNMIMP